MKPEIEKIKAVLSEINEQIGHLQAEKYDPTDDDFESFYKLTKVVEIAVEALEDIRADNMALKQISEILEAK